MVSLNDEPLLDVAEIQGNSLRGFDTRFVDLVGFKLANVAQGRAWLRGLADDIDTLDDVHQHRLARSDGDASTRNVVLLNLALSNACLKAFGFTLAPLSEGAFNLPMGTLAGTYGDEVDGDGLPVNYVLGRDLSDTPDVLLLIGSDDSAALHTQTAAYVAAALAAGFTKIYQERGNVLPGGIEHFGFRDGISSPAPRGLLSYNPPVPLTLRKLATTEPDADIFGRPGQPLVWPGNFVFGYATQTSEDVRRPGAPANAPAWMKNGSLLVFRRLCQDVAGFNAFLQTTATKLTQQLGRNVTEDQVGAMIVGRWKDGTPVVVSDHPDAAISSDDMRINHFEYGGIGAVDVEDGGTRSIPGNASDVPGFRCPHFAHVRKVNPRNQRTNKGAGTLTQSFQMIRRGVPFGPLYADDPTAERGLLFLAYQTSFSRQFGELNQDWMNSGVNPEGGLEGFDLLVGQGDHKNPRTAPYLDQASNQQVTLQADSQFVTPTGGAFLFCPSVGLLRGL